MFEAAWNGPTRQLDPEYVLAKTAAFPDSFVRRFGTAR
jgi:hypothetical protein